MRKINPFRRGLNTPPPISGNEFDDYEGRLVQAVGAEAVLQYLADGLAYPKAVIHAPTAREVVEADQAAAVVREAEAIMGAENNQR